VALSPLGAPAYVRGVDVQEQTRTIERQLDREMQLVADAIRLVAHGGAPRVTIANLRLSDAVLAASAPLAHESGVRLLPRWTADETGVDITIEAIAAGPR
jgi:hypothetical protein